MCCNRTIVDPRRTNPRPLGCELGQQFGLQHYGGVHPVAAVIKQNGPRLCILWKGLGDRVMRREMGKRFEELLCHSVRSHLPELDADGMLSFGGDALEDL